MILDEDVHPAYEHNKFGLGSYCIVRYVKLVRSQMGMNGQHVLFLFFFLEVTLVRHIAIFTLNFEIGPAVWGFIFVCIAKYISLSLLCLKNLTFVSCGVSFWFCI